MLLKEQDLIVYCVSPIGAVVCAGAGDEVVIDALLEQGLMDVLVYFEEEIVFAAVDD